MHDRDNLAHRLTLAGAIALPALLAWHLPPSLDGMDSANFALGLRDFDPGLEQPHLPGYPVYILIARLMHWTGLEDSVALALPGIAASPLLVLAVAAIARHLGVGSSARALLIPLLVLHPLVLAEGARPIPDLLATCLVWSGLAIAVRERSWTSGAILGLAAGVRIDAFAFTSIAGLHPPHRRRGFIGGLAVGLALWVPAFVLASPPDLVARALAFGHGHATRWGSSLLAGAGAPAEILSSVLMAGIGAGGLALFVLGLRHSTPAVRRFVLGGVAPYTVWVFVGQNLAHGRHLLPLAPVSALLVAEGLAAIALPARRLWVAAVAAALVVPLYVRALQPPLDGQARVASVVETCGRCAAVFVGDSKRLFDRYAPPGFPAYRRADIESVKLDLAATFDPAGRLLILDEIDDAAAMGRRLGPPGDEPGLYLIDTATLR